MNKREIVIFLGAISCLAGCTGDFLILFIMKSQFPGYNQLYDTMSYLGSSSSPVSEIVSLWWIILGILIIIFSTGFRIAFSPSDKYVKTAFWLLVIYGLGEGIGSGLFKADSVNDSYTISYIIHDIIGGAGILAILILPLVVLKIRQFSDNRDFAKFSYIVLILGTLFLILFIFRFLPNKIFSINDIALYKGLWQRLFLFVYYIYLIIIAFKMLRIALTKNNT